MVIATCSRVALLRACLRSIAAQEASFPFDIVIVDDGSTDGTREMLAEFASISAVPLLIVAGPCRGVAAARNAGIRAAQGAWIASFDDDQLALPGWLESLHACAVEAKADCVGGDLTLQLEDGADSSELGERVRRVLGEHRIGARPAPYPRGMLPATNNVLFRRAMFDGLHGFDERYVEGGEDTDFFVRAQAAGCRMWHEPNARALHVTPERRLQRDNLRWTSLRLGAGDARWRLMQQGRLGLVRTVLLRLAVAVLRDLPQLAWAVVRGDVHARRNVQCSLWYTSGLVRATFVLNTAGERRSRFLQALDFRARNGERQR